MSFVSFPQTDLDNEENRELTLYDKVFNVASSMLSSFRPDDASIQQQAAPSVSLTNSQQNNSRSESISRSTASSTRSNAHTIRRPSSLYITSGSPTHSSIPNMPSSPAPPTPSSFYARNSIDTIGPSKGSDHQYNTASSRDSFILDLGTPNHNQMQFKHTSQPSVGVSSEYAVPLLPTSSSFSDSSKGRSNSAVAPPNKSFNTVSEYSPSSNQRQQSVDVESLFSVTSGSASREYLASQYSRSRSRAQPSRLGREYWMKDESATSCFSCNRKFTTFRRKHHCRVCGQIFCSTCTTLIEGERCGTEGRRVRCCKACEDALALHSSSDDEVEASFLSQAPMDGDVSSFNTPPPQSAGINMVTSGTVKSNVLASTPSSTKSVAPVHNFHQYINNNPDNDSTWQLSTSPGMHSNILYGGASSLNKSSSQTFDNIAIFDDEENGQNEDQIESYSMFTSPTPIEESHFARSFLGPQHTIRARSRSHTLRDDNNTVNSTGSGINSGGQLTSGALSTTTGLHLYGQNTHNQSNYVNSSSSYGPNHLLSLNINAGQSNTGIFNSCGTGVSMSSSRQALARFPNSATVEMNNAARSYLLLFLGQLLKDSELDPEKWKSILTAPLLEVAAGLHLELNDRLSPREWVKIKRIPGGKPTDIDCICGTVFTHTLARRSMSLRIKSPRIMIISFPIEYARVERYMSLDPVVAQEKEYLRKLIARIAALKPTILLTCSHICGKAMDLLEERGIAVAQSVRDSALFRLSRITRADILTSIDRLSTQPQLGTCELFEQRSYRAFDEVKTFMFFFVRPADPGRCALVRGEPEISGVVKVVLEVMAEICYSLKAETALMRDQLVNVPNITDPSPLILSSSPFVNYGTPFLEMELNYLEDSVVQLGEIPQSHSDNSGEEGTTNQAVDEQQKAESRVKDGEDDYAWKTSEYIRLSDLEATRTKWLQVSRLWEGIESSYPFMFNPSSHQNLLVLYSLVCEDTATPCSGPDAQLIEFYLSTDQTLGSFVESNITLADEKCPDGCDHKLLSHSRKYINGNGMVNVSVEQMPCKVSGLDDSILMWSYCTLCEQNMPVAPMSSTTWKYSMGKYLELSLYGEPLKMRASTCPHNVYRDHVRYFGWHGYALKIQYHSIQLYEIAGPPAEMRYKPELEISMKEESYSTWQGKLGRFWQSLFDSLMKVKVEGLEQDMIELSHERLEALKSKAILDRETCSDLLSKLYHDSEPNDYLSLNKILEFYQQLVDNWHSDLADFDGEFFPTERDIRRVTAMHIRGLLGEDPVEKKMRTESNENGRNSPTTNEIYAQSSEPCDGSSSNKEESLISSVQPHKLPGNQECKSPKNDRGDVLNQENSLTHENTAPEYLVDSDLPKAIDSETEGTGLDPAEVSKQQPVNVKSRFGNNISLSMPGLTQGGTSGNGGGRVAFLAKHFEELSREFERERQRANQRLKDRQRSIMMRHANTVAEVFEDVTDEIEDWPQYGCDTKSLNLQSRSSNKNSAHELSSNIDDFQSVESPSTNTGDSNGKIKGSPTLSLHEPRATDNSQNTTYDELNNTTLQNELGPVKSNSDVKDDDDARKAEPAKMSLIRSLANFWSERSSTRWNGIDYMLSFNEHYFTNSDVVVRENEPSSLIAFSLSLSDYQSRINEFYETTPNITPAKSTENADVDLLEQAMLRQTGTHMRYYFDRNTVKASCKIFFSEQFDALRRKCMIPSKYIQSLSSCSTWDSTGGKSGSAFLKTSDDRLILKELSHAEFDSFINFAPSYFEYMAQALFHDLPTFLAKIFGVYQISMRSTQKSQPVKMYVLVMENLFYGRKFDKFFDLKGSMRNRKVAETGKANEVLLDENMVEYIYETPVFVREHSKRMLRASLYNDTLFLTKMNVMDYSLVIGLDEENNTIVAGIIDYIRTYTWDKKIESWVKARAATSNIKEPTVVSPKQYKGRFRESMERYFVMVPDCWSQPIN